MRPRLLRRGREEDGFALASAIMIMLLVMLVTAVGALAVVRSFDETRRDRSSTSALSAADAAVDVLVWRMNKQLTASEIENVGGLTQALVGELGCADVNAAGIVEISLSATSCDLSVTVGDGAAATCQSRLAVPLTAAGLVDLSSLTLLSRNIVCSSTVDGATRRIFARVSVPVTVASTLASPTSLWERRAWQECPSDPSATCPPA